MSGIDVNRGSSGVVLTPVASQEIWAAVLENSAVMRLARRIDLPGSGVSVPVITGEPTANWVNETDIKPVSRPTLNNKIITPYSLAVILPMSNQFKRDKAALAKELVRRLPYALARKFDSTVFGPASGAPGSNFDTLGAATASSITANTYDSLVSADSVISTGGGLLSGWVFALQGKALLRTAKDTTGRPLFIDSATDGDIPSLFGAPVHITKSAYIAGTPAQLGYAGDFTDAVYGIVEGINVAISDQASITDGANTINLFERNMFAVRCEAEFGFRVRDIAEFVKLTA